MAELKNILYADDESDIREIVKIAIEATSSCTIKFAENGRELLGMVEDFKPDLIMLDAMMPELNGMETFEELKKSDKTKDIPVVFITAKAQFHEIEQLGKLGVLGIISKPFNPMTLFDSINEMWTTHYGKS